MRATTAASSGTDSCSSASAAAAARSVEVRHVLLVTCRSASRTAKTVTATCASAEKNGSQSEVTAPASDPGCCRPPCAAGGPPRPPPCTKAGGRGDLSVVLAVHQLQSHLGPPLAGGRGAGAGG